MNYIENDGKITRDYEIRINTEELQKIIQELDAKCYRIVNKNIKVAAYNKEQAIEKINMAINSAGIKVNALVNISEGYKDLVDYPGSLFVFDCDCLCKQSSSLVTILEKILINYNSNIEFRKQNNRLIDFLIGFEESDELKSYEERGKDCREKVENLLENNPNDLDELYHLHEESQKLSLERKYNQNYDFELLRSLYQKAKNCFELILVSETVHYKDLNNNPKVYKLGTKRKI